jgi:hypothetical protein
MSESQNLCGHEGCQCTVSGGEQYCSEYCREATATERAETPFCECGHAACANNPAGGSQAG